MSRVFAALLIVGFSYFSVASPPPQYRERQRSAAEPHEVGSLPCTLIEMKGGSPPSSLSRPPYYKVKFGDEEVYDASPSSKEVSELGGVGRRWISKGSNKKLKRKAFREAIAFLAQLRNAGLCE